MQENKKQTAQSVDDQLFAALQRNKRRRRLRIWLTAGGITLAILLLIGMAVHSLRRRVDEKFNAGASDVLSYTASTGSISTTVSGTGILEDLDPEELRVPDGVEVEEIKVSVNDPVKKGDIIAELDMSTVLSAMSQAQKALDDFDLQLTEAGDDAVDEGIKAGVSGRVMRIYCAEGDAVSDCMYANGSLMVLSTDGLLTGRIPAGQLRAGDSVTLQRNDGSEYPGLVDSLDDGEAVVTLEDDKANDGEKVSILDADGNVLASCVLEIRNPLRVTGFAGNVKRINVDVGDRVSDSTEVITLSDTEYSANYESILRQRKEKEEELQQLLKLSHDGALLSPIDGTVCFVQEQEEDQAQPVIPLEKETDEPLVSVSTDRQMCLTVNVDESDILSLQEGQTAELTVAPVGDDPFQGTVTQIDQSAQSVSGVTLYRAKIVLDKAKGMLPGMSAKAKIRIQGVDNTIIIPVDAVHQTSAAAFVYTSYDPQAGEYGGKVEVTTGLKNANEVEITSGLKAGDVVYYTEREKFDPWGFGSFGSGWDASYDYGEYPGTADVGSPEWRQYSGQGYDVSVG